MGWQLKSVRRLLMPWSGEGLVNGHKRRFPNSIVYKLFSISTAGGAVCVVLFLIFALWTLFGGK